MDDLVLFDRFLKIVKDKKVKYGTKKHIEYGLLLELLIYHYGIELNDFNSIQYIKNQLNKAKRMDLISIIRDKNYNDYVSINY